MELRFKEAKHIVLGGDSLKATRQLFKVNSQFAFIKSTPMLLKMVLNSSFLLCPTAYNKSEMV